ncbi:MAG: ADP-ribosylglycohydrolase [Verrucomicrobiales bacterium]|jgi:ADP-ribosylglycohydrolase
MSSDPCSLKPASRRGFLRSFSSGSIGVIGMLLLNGKAFGQSEKSDSVPSRVRGMLLGALIGDALGGPVEFQQLDDVAKLSDPPKRWEKGEKLTSQALEAAEVRLKLRPYSPLRPAPESYGHWLPNAAAGTVTDDSRHKFVLMHAMRRAREKDDWPITGKSLAQAYVDWSSSPLMQKRPDYRQLSDDWLDEFLKSARWVLGERNPALAFPPERMWSGLPTCCGQMILPPLAAIYPGDPDAAYRAAYALGFFDNGFGKDLNASLIAGMATALTLPKPLRAGGDWLPVIDAMRKTDPFAYGKVPWAMRSVDKWLERTQAAVQRANREPAALFAELNAIFSDTIKWQAEVPFVVAMAVLTLCPDHPLAALQLSIEWGHDTDSYSALVGALIGARYGEDIFPEHLKKPVIDRLQADYQESVSEWADVLASIATRQEVGMPVCDFD